MNHEAGNSNASRSEGFDFGPQYPLQNVLNFSQIFICNNKEWVFVYRHWCEENEMVFVSHEVPFPATSDRRSRVAGNGTECEVKTIELSSPTSGGEQWAFLNFIIFIAVKKTVPKLRKIFFFYTNSLAFFSRGVWSAKLKPYRQLSLIWHLLMKLNRCSNESLFTKF